MSAYKSDFLQVLADRGFIHQVSEPDALDEKAKAGTIKNFTGFDAPYEAPERPEIHLHTIGQQPEQLAHHLIAKLTELGLIR